MIIHFLENILLIVLTAFLFVVPFDKHAVRILLCIGLIAIILLSILKYKSKFYRALIPNVSVFKFLFLFFIAAAISTLFGLNPYYSQQILFQRYLPYLIIFVWDTPSSIIVL